MESECAEIKDCLYQNDTSTSLQEEVGDLLLVAIQVCLYCHWDPERVLSKSEKKFRNRLEALHQLMQNKSLHTLSGCSFSTIQELWEEAKKLSLKSRL